MMVSWVGRPVPVFWWMELDLVSLEVSAVSSSVFWGICGFSVDLGRLPVDVQSCAPVLLKDRYGASQTGPHWLLGGARSVLSWGPSGGLLSINVPCDEEFSEGPKS